MTPEQHDALALEVAAEVYDGPLKGGAVILMYEFARRYRAALAERMEPVAWVKLSDESDFTLQKPVVESGYLLLYSLEGWK